MSLCNLWYFNSKTEIVFCSFCGEILVSALVLLAISLIPFPMTLQNHRHSRQADFVFVLCLLFPNLCVDFAIPVPY